VRKKEYFCGWYFKCQSEEESIALIPAVHISQGKQTGSIQFISGKENWNFDLPGERVQIRKDRPYAALGANTFSEEGVYLDLHQDSLSATGVLQFGRPSAIRFDIMGPFCCLPFMECRHSVFSMRHEVDGWLQVNERCYRFEKGTGYIEGDRGRSFPSRYMWTQCCFEEGALMLAAAEIPVGPAHFTGVIGIVQLRGKEYRLATYLGARVLKIGDREVTVRQGDLTMTAELLDHHACLLRAPANGSMTRTIRENVACRARYQFCRRNQVLLDFETSKASFEFEY